MCWVRVMRVSDGFPHAGGLRVCAGAVYDVVMTEVFLKTTANKAGYVTVRVQNATGEVALNGALSLMDRRVEMVPHADGVLGFEPLSNGTWLLEVRANGATVLYGKVLVLPTPIDAPPGNDSWEFVLDAAEGMALVDVVLSQGPVGPRGETGPQGPAGKDGKDGTMVQCIHVSFDDVKNVTAALAAGTLESAWDNPFLAMLKEAHEQYNMCFSLYLYQTLPALPTKYQAELGAAADWLKWGLHDLSGSDYSSATYEKGQSDWNAVVNAVMTLTGSQQAIDRMPRLHMFAGSREALCGMRDASMGALGFLAADSSRSSYYLDAERSAYLFNENDHLTDFENALVFYRTDLRLDWFTDAGFSYTAGTTSVHLPSYPGDIERELELRYGDTSYMNTWTCFTIFAHEWQPLSAISAALDAIGSFAETRGISFGYPQNMMATLSSKDIHAAASPEVDADTFEPFETTVTDGLGKQQYATVVDKIEDGVLKNGCTGSGYACTTSPGIGRATYADYVFMVPENSVLTFTPVIEGLVYAVAEHTTVPITNNTCTPNGQTWRAWLTDPVLTLQPETRYLRIGFKNGDKSENFTDEELALVHYAISVKQA